jgi:type IV secretory pathway ATPase VirB11/archaellum biosynthesis ATPase
VSFSVAELSLADLVRNRTMSPEIAATLEQTARERGSFLVIALPRMAGKSTVGKAMLAVARRQKYPVRELGEDGTDVAALARAARGGYLYVPEVSRYPVTAGYVWGAPVRAAFAAIGEGTSLSTALHADSAEDALRILRANRVAPGDLDRLELIVHLRSLGEDWQNPTRRVVADVHAHGPKGLRLLHRWDERTDRFESR